MHAILMKNIVKYYMNAEIQNNTVIDVKQSLQLISSAEPKYFIRIRVTEKFILQIIGNQSVELKRIKLQFNGLIVHDLCGRFLQRWAILRFFNAINAFLSKFELNFLL